MSKAVSRGIALELMATAMKNIDWDSLDGEVLQKEVNELPPQEVGQRFTAFLRNKARLVIAEPKILRLDPSPTFNPAEFIGEGWITWKGPADGDGLTGEEAVDTRSLSLAEIDFSKVLYETCLIGDEKKITGEEKMRRLTASNHIRLGGNVFINLWNDYQRNKGNSVIEWVRRTFAIAYLDFPGLVLRSPSGRRFVLCFCWDGCGWSWGYSWLGGGWFADSRSASLAS